LEADIKDVWLTDSGASRHITFRRDWLVDFKASTGETISLGDNAACEVHGTGTVLIEKHVDDTWEQGRIENVFSMFRKSGKISSHNQSEYARRRITKFTSRIAKSQFY